MSSKPLISGRYLLEELLGAGGTSVVWRGYDEVLGRSVAVKLLDVRYAADAASRERIRAEARVAARLSHPYICRVFDYGEALDESGDTLPYLVMELLPGSTLADQLRAGPMPVAAALRLGAQVASALAAAHQCGLVHRDIKPGNIVLAPAGPKVVDFGIAAAAGEAGEPRSDGEVWGTPAYVAPERLTGGDVTPATDVYALGLVLYRALTGRAPWSATTVTDMLEAHQDLPPTPLPVMDGLPAAVADLCAGSLAKDPDQRPTAQDMAECLAEASGLRVSAQAGGVLIGPGDRPEPVAVGSPVVRPGPKPALLPALRPARAGSALLRQAFAGSALARAGMVRPAALTAASPAAASPAELAAESPAAVPASVGARRPGRSPVPLRPATVVLRYGPLRALAAAATLAIMIGPLGGIWLLGSPTDHYLGVEVVSPTQEPSPESPSAADSIPPRGGAAPVGPVSRADSGALPTSERGGGGGGDPVDAGSTSPAGSSGSGPAGSAPAGTDPPGTGSPGTGSPGTDPPGSEPPGGSTPSPSPTPEQVVRTLTDPLLGSLTVACVGATATLLDHSVLLEDATLGTVNAGPGSTVGITIVDLLGLDTELTAHCQDGVPVLS